MTVSRERLLRFAIPAAIAGALAGAYLVSTAPSTAFAGPNTIPDRIADTTFWRMFNEMSERGGTFRSDNFVSNETQLQYVIPKLQREITPGGVYVGVGPEQNLTYIVALAPKIAFIVDIRRQNALEHLMYKGIIELSANRAEFLSRLYSRPLVKGPYADGNIGKMIQAYIDEPGDTVLYRKNFDELRDHLRKTHGFLLTVDDLASLEYVTRAFFTAGPDLTYSMGRASAQGNPGRGPFATNRISVYRIPGSNWTGMPPAPGRAGANASNAPPRRGMPSFALLMSEDDGTGTQRGFLASESNFQALKDFEARNLLIPVVGDFAGDKALRAVGDYARAHRANVDVFYTSNVEQYLWQQGDDWSRFYKNVATMPVSEHSTFIRSASGGMGYRNGGSMRMAQLTLPIAEFLRQLHDGHVQSYRDVLGLSH